MLWLPFHLLHHPQTGNLSPHELSDMRARHMRSSRVNCNCAMAPTAVFQTLFVFIFPAEGLARPDGLKSGLADSIQVAKPVLVRPEHQLRDNGQPILIRFSSGRAERFRTREGGIWNGRI